MLLPFSLFQVPSSLMLSAGWAPAERRTLQYEVHGRDAFGNDCSLLPKAVSLHSVPEGAIAAGTLIEPGRSTSSVLVSASVLTAGAARVLPSPCQCCPLRLWESFLGSFKC